MTVILTWRTRKYNWYRKIPNVNLITSIPITISSFYQKTKELNFPTEIFLYLTNSKVLDALIRDLRNAGNPLDAIGQCQLSWVLLAKWLTCAYEALVRVLTDDNDWDWEKNSWRHSLRLRILGNRELYFLLLLFRLCFGLLICWSTNNAAYFLDYLRLNRVPIVRKTVMEPNAKNVYIYPLGHLCWILCTFQYNQITNPFLKVNK